MLAEAYAKLAVPHIGKYWSTHDPAHLDRAFDLARTSFSLRENSDAHASMSLVYAYHDKMDLAIFHADRALALNPNHTLAATDRAYCQPYNGDAQGALAGLEKVLERDPIPPSWYWDAKAATLFQLQQYKEAIDALNMISNRKPWQDAYMAAAMVYLGQVEEARKLVVLILAADPTITATKILKTERYQCDPYRKHLDYQNSRTALTNKWAALQPLCLTEPSFLQKIIVHEGVPLGFEVGKRLTAVRKGLIASL